MNMYTADIIVAQDAADRWVPLLLDSRIDFSSYARRAADWDAAGGSQRTPDRIFAILAFFFLTLRPEVGMGVMVSRIDSRFGSHDGDSGRCRSASSSLSSSGRDICMANDRGVECQREIQDMVMF